MNPLYLVIRSHVKNFFLTSIFFLFNANEIRLAIYPILDEPIISQANWFVKSFFLSSFLFFCQVEWIRLVTNLILYVLIIPNSQLGVKKKFLSFSFYFGMDFSVSKCVDLFLPKKSLDFLASLSYNKTIKRQGWSLCSYP